MIILCDEEISAKGNFEDVPMRKPVSEPVFSLKHPIFANMLYAKVCTNSQAQKEDEEKIFRKQESFLAHIIFKIISRI